MQNLKTFGNDYAKAFSKSRNEGIFICYCSSSV